jgi:ferredoxin
MSPSIILRVLRERCQGHARCHALAPELFVLDEFGNARETSAGPIPRELEDKAFVAQANCPESAILVENLGGD